MLKRKWNNKQYCGDVESDPFDYVYRGSVFDPFKESNKVPTVKEHTYNSATIDTEDLIEDIQMPAHRLTAKVRQQYLYYLDRVLRKNYHTWLASYSSNHNDDPFTDDELRQCAETIEMRAVQSCMITSLYRNYILQKLGEIRKQTVLGLIHPNLTDVKFKPAVVKREQCHVGVQTEANIALTTLSVPTGDTPLANVPQISLEEKMQLFQRNNIIAEKSLYLELSGDGNVSSECTTYPVQKSKEMPQTMDSVEATVESKRPRNEAMDDEILKELQAMFEPSDEEATIFGWCADQERSRMVANERETIEPLLGGSHTTGTHFVRPSSPKIDRTVLHPAAVTSSGPQDLRCSMWPCELHMQRMKLRNLLVKIAEDNYRRYERLVQNQFVALFGEDDGEEQDLGPYSPTIELNEELVSSCRQRIAKWVVQALMRPLNDGLIANRFLFKKLAKRLADGIIYLNQYPDKKFIRNYVNDYFCSHSQIQSIEDIT
ncbi:uncharacterized protein LOC128708764 [Anopheles marshallii]|uniref:uncharacterized protein LOC128708764 n=1 Tax=Anopheles marshallii TaxID=1521116 RepID=UPI00237BAB56|nr:uncharacterized protein LOC128708764 [Anopheles marshallii]